MRYKFFAGLLCCTFLVAILAACGTSEQKSVESTDGISTDAPSQSPSKAPVESPSEPIETETSLIDVSTATQHVVENNESSSASLGGKWPENEFTRQLPKLTSGNISMSLTQRSSFELLASDLTLEEAKAYIDGTIEKGFDIEAEMKDYTESGIEAYTYSAKNAAGYEVCLSYSVGLLSISMKK